MQEIESGYYVALCSDQLYPCSVYFANYTDRPMIELRIDSSAWGPLIATCLSQPVSRENLRTSPPRARGPKGPLVRTRDEWYT